MGMNKTTQKVRETPLACGIIAGKISDGANGAVSVKNGALVFS